jgi:hypothetical protein
MLSTVQYLLEHGGAVITQTLADGRSVWELLPEDAFTEKAAEMTALLRSWCFKAPLPMSFWSADYWKSTLL